MDWLGLWFAKPHVIKINGWNPINSSSAGTLGKPTSDYQDFKKANILAFGKNDPFGAKASPGFIWHHDTEGMMRLLPKDIHKSVKHTGSAAQHQTWKGKGKRKGKR